MSDFRFPRTTMLHGGCSKWFLVQWRTNFWQTNNLAAGRTEPHLGTTNAACIEHVVKGAGRSTPTGSVWKTLQGHQQTTHRTNRINRLQYKHLECRSKNTKKGHFKGQLQGLDKARLSLAGHSSQRHGFHARPVQARVELNKVAPGQILLPVLRHSPVSIVPLMTQTHSILTLLSIGQRDLPKSTALSEIGKHRLQK